jgi:hypothetical protein
VRGWIKTGELKAARVGTRIGYRIRLGDYEDFLRRRTLTGAIAAHLLRGASAAPQRLSTTGAARGDRISTLS